MNKFVGVVVLFIVVVWFCFVFVDFVVMVVLLVLRVIMFVSMVDIIFLECDGLLYLKVIYDFFFYVKWLIFIGKW